MQIRTDPEFNRHTTKPKRFQITKHLSEKTKSDLELHLVLLWFRWKHFCLWHTFWNDVFYGQANQHTESISCHREVKRAWLFKLPWCRHTSSTHSHIIHPNVMFDNGGIVFFEILCYLFSSVVPFFPLCLSHSSTYAVLSLLPQEEESATEGGISNRGRKESERPLLVWSKYVFPQKNK